LGNLTRDQQYVQNTRISQDVARPAIGVGEPWVHFRKASYSDEHTMVRIEPKLLKYTC
jgi:hypothetical protein